MSHVTIRFYVGLRDREGELTSLAEREDTLAMFAERYDGFTHLNGNGVWQGKAEPSWILETINLDRGKLTRTYARHVARELAQWMRQQCVGLSISSPVEWSTEEPHS